MSVITKEGFAALRFAYVVVVGGIGVALFLTGGSYLYWQSEKANNVTSKRALSDMQSRLANAKRERADLRDSEDTYKALAGRGVFVTENRLDLLDAMDALKTRHNIVSLEYRIGAQRPLVLASGTAITAVDALGSRIQFKASALHDGDMVAFLDEFPRLQRGLFPVDRCILKRSLSSAEIEAKQARQLLLQQQTTNRRTVITEGETEREIGVSTIAPGVEAECSLEWITLLDKQAPAALTKTAATPSAASK